MQLISVTRVMKWWRVCDGRSDPLAKEFRNVAEEFTDRPTYHQLEKSNTSFYSK
jgi:hypothetical protein